MFVAWLRHLLARSIAPRCESRGRVETRAASLADLHSPGTRVEAGIDDLYLTRVAFDAHTLRIVAQVRGTVHATVSKLPKL